MICRDCLSECQEVEFKDGFFYDYGSITGAWHDESGTGSDCCHAEVAEGRIWLDRTTDHVARKDHLTPAGNVHIAKGQRYRCTIRKGYMVKADGGREAIFEIYKGVI